MYPGGHGNAEKNHMTWPAGEDISETRSIQPGFVCAECSLPPLVLTVYAQSWCYMHVTELCFVDDSSPNGFVSSWTCNLFKYNEEMGACTGAAWSFNSGLLSRKLSVFSALREVFSLSVQNPLLKGKQIIPESKKAQRLSKQYQKDSRDNLKRYLLTKVGTIWIAVRKQATWVVIKWS